MISYMVNKERILRIFLYGQGLKKRTRGPASVSLLRSFVYKSEYKLRLPFNDNKQL